MTAPEIKQEIHHYNWIRPLKNNKVQIMVFRAYVCWHLPDLNMKFDYEV